MINKNNKAQFQISKFLIALASFSVIFGLFFIYVFDMADTYNTPNIVDSSLNKTFNRFHNDSSDSQVMYNEIRNSSGLGFVGQSGTLLKSAWNVIQTIVEAPFRMNEMFIDVGETFNVPTPIINLAIGFWYVSIIFLIIMALVNYFSRGGKPL